MGKLRIPPFLPLQTLAAKRVPEEQPWPVPCCSQLLWDISLQGKYLFHCLGLDTVAHFICTATFGHFIRINRHSLKSSANVVLIDLQYNTLLTLTIMFHQILNYTSWNSTCLSSVPLVRSLGENLCFLYICTNGALFFQIVQKRLCKKYNQQNTKDKKIQNF